MDPELWRRAQALFGEVAALPEAERAALLAARAAGDSELRRTVERLLAADTSAEQEAFLESRPSHQAAAPLPAAIGRYGVLERLGRGGYGEVFRAFDPVLKREVAIKTCFEGSARDRERFAREAEIVARLEHPNISRVYDFGVAGEVPYLVQELLAGEDLSAWIERRPQAALARRAAWLLDAARGLAHAHAHGVVHRDVKPGNLRRLPDDTVKVLDFGVARQLDAARSRSGEVAGTLAYMAPERLREDADEESAAADVYAWAAVAWELLAGRRRSRAQSPLAQLYESAAGSPESLLEVAPDCPPALAALIERGLARDPARRPRDANRLLAELEPVVAALRGEPAASPGRRPRPAAGRAILLAALIAAGLLGAVLIRRQTGPAGRLAPVATDGVLRIDARPWARVTGVTDATGQAAALPPRATTPLGLVLPAGEYRVTMEAGGERRVCAAAVRPGGGAICAVEFAAVDVDRFLAEALR